MTFRVGWLMDDPGYIGGAELTMAEFRRAAPESVEIVDCPPGEIAPADRYVIGNDSLYGQRPSGVRYVHDVRGGARPGDEVICCSAVLAKRLGYDDAHLIPPAIDLEAFTPSRQVRRNGKRSGSCAVGSWMGPGKGQQAILEWAQQNGPVDVYGEGPCTPQGRNLEAKGLVPHEQVPTVLWGYERFVHLPSVLEPFGRAVVEAWAAGLEIVCNGLVGALEWIRNDPDALESAAEDFWAVVLEN